MIGVALSELCLAPTKWSIFQTVGDPQARQELQIFTPDDLAGLYERAIDLDSNLLLLAFGPGAQENQLTMAFTLIFMV